jgi:drug/metabolite transporter (DMT)-like permease
VIFIKDLLKRKKRWIEWTTKRSAMRRRLLGRHSKAYGATLIVVLLASSAPAVTRLSLSNNLSSLDLVLLRCGIGGLVFLPYFLSIWRSMPRRLLLTGLVLAFLHGWGMHLTAIAGLQFSPAAHASALGPGFLSVWVMLWRWLLCGVHAERLECLGLGFIASGALLLVAYSYNAWAHSQWLLGDLLFLLSSCLAAAYLVYLQRQQANPLQVATLVAVYSGIAGGLLLLLSPSPSALWSAPLDELLTQALFQGLGMGAAAILMTTYATRELGSQRFSIFIAAIPVLSLLFGSTIAGDAVHAQEAAAAGLISAGIFLGAVLGGPRVRLNADTRAMTHSASTAHKP